MQAVQIFDYGGKDKLELVDVPMPELAEGEALVRISYAGVNFIDVYMRKGEYRHSDTYGSELPITLGMEGGGTVEAVGPGVDNVKPSDRVAYCLSRGSYAQYARVPAWKLVKVPDAVPLDIATTLMLQGCTAHYLSHSLFPLSSDHTCLFHAGAGGVGQLFIQLARLRGARVLTTVGGPQKAEIVRSLGAEPILYREVDFREAVMDATDDRGVDVVYDSVGKETIGRSIRCLRRRGVCANFGGSSGMVESIKPLDLAEAGSVFFTRPHLAHYMADAGEIDGRTADLFAAVIDNRINVTIDRIFPLDEAAKAHATIEGRQTKGKLLLLINTAG
ncbi:MAG: quinone oxidoreductase [Acidiferrobacterales bacterium]